VYIYVLTGDLYEDYNQQCCGGNVVKGDMVCCGGANEGHAYTARHGMMCCGLQYILNDTSLCCGSDTGHIKVSALPSAFVVYFS